MLYLNEISQYIPTVAYAAIFIYGVTDNSVSTYNNVAVGFEFTNKLVAFGCKMFIENVAVTVFLTIFSLFPPESKEAFRGILIVYLTLGIVATFTIMRIARHFK